MKNFYFIIEKISNNSFIHFKKINKKIQNKFVIKFYKKIHSQNTNFTLRIKKIISFRKISKKLFSKSQVSDPNRCVIRFLNTKKIDRFD